MNFPLQKQRATLPAKIITRLGLAVTGLCLALSACISSSPPPLPPLSKNATVLALGDSLTYGVGALPADSYPAQLQKIIRRQVVAAGIPGETSAQALKRLPRLLSHHRPALVIVCTGGNDFLQRLPPEQTEENINRILQMVKDAGVAAVLIAVPTFSLWKSNHPLYARVAGGRWWLEDEIMKEVLHDNLLKSDRIHPNAAGYRRIAEAVAMLLVRASAI